MTAYLRPSSRGQPNNSIEFLFIIDATIYPVQWRAGRTWRPPTISRHLYPEWANKANKIKGTGQATLTTKIELLITVKVTDVWISGDEK